MNAIKFGSFVVLGSIVSLSVIADPVSVNPRPRMLSMGGAGAAVTGDKDSAMMNPAGLNDVQKSRWMVLPFTVEIPFDVGLLTDSLDVQDFLSDDTKTDAQKREKFEDFLGDVESMALGTRVNFYPSWTRKNFHIGLLADFYVNPKFRAGGVTSNQVMELGGSAGTGGLILGASHAFLNNRLQVGLTVKPLYRVSLTDKQTQTAHDLVKGMDPNGSFKDEILGKNVADRKGFAVGADLGVKYYLPFLEGWKPTVAVTYQDIGNTRFFGSSNKPRNIEQSVSAGLAVEKRFGITKNTFAVDFRNLTEEQEFENKIHFGAESVLFDLIALRAGMSQLYWTAGLGLETRFFEFDFYVAAKEAGEKAHIQEERVLGTRLAFAF